MADDTTTAPDSNQPAAAPKPGTKEYLQAQVTGYVAELAAAQVDKQTLAASLAQAEADRDAYQAQVLDLGGQLQDVTGQLRTLRASYDELAGTQQAASQAEATAAVDEQAALIASTKDLLKRNGLPQAYLMPDGSICFDKGYALHFVGQEVFDSLTVISAE